MKRKKRNVSEESYWKSATDIMAGVLLVILLVLMLLLLYLTQMKKEDYENKADYDGYGIDYDLGDNFQPTTEVDYHKYDGSYMEPPEEGGGGGGGGGEDDPGTDVPQEINPDEGHDKTAVFVTVVDEETGNVIKKAGTLFELYADKNGVGGLQTLHTYYPEKIEYKQYQTTDNGTFYLPEKITKGWYSFHNLVAPEGYGKADNFDFEVSEPLDWPEPYLVKIPFSPSKNNIFVRTVDADTQKAIGGVTYEVYASEDIVTLDGTVRYSAGQKVDEIKCDKNGAGQSKKLYLGKYYLVQTTAAQYYARVLTQVDVEIKMTDTAEKNAAVVQCKKTQIAVTLRDEFDDSPIVGATYSVTDKEALKTDENGALIVTDLEKNKEYTVTLTELPSPYRIKSHKAVFQVDQDGNISGNAQALYQQLAYKIRLTVDVKDQIFRNSVSSGYIFKLLDSNDQTVDEWESVGADHMIDDIEPGTYQLEINGDSSSRLKVNVKDVGTVQKFETKVWTIWDTVLVIAGIITTVIVLFITIRVIRYLRRKKKQNGKQKNTVKEK